jgi:hypothetical protein
MSLLFDHGLPSQYNIRCNNLTVDGKQSGGGGGGGQTIGSWIPTLIFNGADLSTYGGAYTSSGTYVLNTNLVFVSGNITISSLGSVPSDSEPVTVGGLITPVGAISVPTCLSCTWSYCPLVNEDANNTIITSHSIPGTSTLSLNVCNASSGSEDPLYPMWLSGSSIINFSGTYFTV